LTFDKSGNLFAANDGLGTSSPDSISKFNSNGQFQSALTSNVLHDSHGIVIDSSGNLYVADFTGGKINKFDQGGNQLFSITSNLSGPIGLALDQSGNLYASNYNNNSISIFNTSGSYQSSISSNLSGPIGLAFDNAGRLFAVNNTNNSISIFASNGTYISSITTGLSQPRFIAISATSVPEPSTYALAAIASGVMALIARRRNQSKA
jgi:streptogramin lyase